MFLKLTKCPHCKKTLKAELNEPSDSPLGVPAVLFCLYCGKPISNGKREWADMGVLKKTVYILRSLLTVFYVGFLVSFFTVIAISSSSTLTEFFPDSIVPVAMVIFLAAGCWVAYYIRREIMESIARTKKNS